MISKGKLLHTFDNLFRVFAPVLLFIGISLLFGIITNFVRMFKIGDYKETNGYVWNEGYSFHGHSEGRLGNISSSHMEGDKRGVRFCVGEEEYYLSPMWLPAECTSGTKIIVLYNPANPDYAIISKDLHISGLKRELLIACIFCVIGLTGFYRMYVHFFIEKKRKYIT